MGSYNPTKNEREKGTSLTNQQGLNLSDYLGSFGYFIAEDFAFDVAEIGMKRHWLRVETQKERKLKMSAKANRVQLKLN